MSQRSEWVLWFAEQYAYATRGWWKRKKALSQGDEIVIEDEPEQLNLSPPTGENVKDELAEMRDLLCAFEKSVQKSRDLEAEPEQDESYYF
jgi:hypothetical protein